MSEPTSLEVRLRLIEAAARAPVVHKDGPAAGVLEVAKTWADWVFGSQKAGTLGLPKK
jgi:hypothetical protein